MQHDREMAAAMEVVRRTGAEIAFVAGVTQVGLDDDLLRMRSKMVVNHGFSQINNPCKGLGVIHHGAVSVTTGLYIGGHVAARGESTLDCVKILQRSMTGRSSESQIRLDGNTFFWDRGYGGIDWEVNRWSIGVGTSLLGTAKRMRSFPFTYDQNPGPDRVLIAEKGAAAEYWAKKPCSTARTAPGTIAAEHFACAYRNGLGRVVLMQTTEKNCGPGNYTLVTRRKRDDLPEPTIHSELALFETNNIIQLTASQRTPEWFNQHRFRITGTGALAVWRHFASCS
ncbi:hypothetical protein MHU86_5018 [Fragilaria crotonensis]|nr:hypothetical protein MHU86_5018 [Fragilaria crotonensis]